MKEIFAVLKAHRERWLPIALLVFLAIATLLTLTLTQKKQELRSKALEDTATLTFNPTTINKGIGETFTIIISMYNGGQPVIGADIIANFDNNSLELTGITQPAPLDDVYKTYAPVTTTGTFDAARVKDCANLGSFGGDTTKCPSGAGNVEFGIVSFDWTANDGTGGLTSPVPSPITVSPVVTLNFTVKPEAVNNIISFVYTGVTSTTDSNVVVNPPGANPEDILAQPTSTINVTIAEASPTPSPSSSPIDCTPATCFDYTPQNGIVDISDVQKVVNRLNLPLTDPNYNIIYNVSCPKDVPVSIQDVQYVVNRLNLAQSCTP